MATARVLTAEDWNDRAEALALAHHLEDAAELERVAYAGEDADGNGLDATDTYRVPSSSHAGEVHHVAHHVASHELRCDCVAATYGRPCGHAGAVRIAISRRGMALETWCRATGRWQEVQR